VGASFASPARLPRRSAGCPRCFLSSEDLLTVLVNRLTRGLFGPIRSHASHSLLMTRMMFVSDGCPRRRRSSTVIRPSARASRMAFFAVDLQTSYCVDVGRARAVRPHGSPIWWKKSGNHGPYPFRKSRFTCLERAAHRYDNSFLEIPLDRSIYCFYSPHFRTGLTCLHYPDLVPLRRAAVKP
jgi:hypothetical protein